MAVLYGAGAYTGSNPIGGGNGYVSPHGFSQGTADYVVDTLAELNSAMASATSGKVIWIPDGVTINVPTVANATARMWLPNPLNTGVALASNRGQSGAAGGKIKLTGTVSGAFATGLWCKSNSILSGLTIEGPTNWGFSGKTTCYTLFALKISAAVNVEVENCHLYNFPQGIITIDNVKGGSGEQLAWNSANRHKIHHSTIHGAQAHGWGYGVLQSNSNGYSLSALVEACQFYDCRHHIACDHGAPYNYEIRYSIFDDSWYWSLNNPGGTKYYACQIDAHGSGHTMSGFAGRHYEIHHNTLSANGNKANFGCRGNPNDEHRLYNNWTKKTHNGVTGVYPAGGGYEGDFIGGCFVDLEGSEGGAWSSTPCSRCTSGTYKRLDTHKVFVFNTWYGSAEAPPGQPPPPPPPDPEPEPSEPEPPPTDVEPYEKTNWVPGQTLANETNLNHLETQYDSAITRLNSVALSTPSRALDTVYQNTSGKPLWVSVTHSIIPPGTVAAVIGQNSLPNHLTAWNALGSGEGYAAVATLVFLVPPGWYYQGLKTGYQTASPPQLLGWREWTVH
jgi:hypothetical protein